MVFRHPGDGEKRAVVLEPGSLLVMSGAARYDWTHEIPARTSDVIGGERRARGRRVSLTFRAVVRMR
jgi:alkylated DNA repair dioxygenase AlkB